VSKGVDGFFCIFYRYALLFLYFFFHSQCLVIGSDVDFAIIRLSFYLVQNAMFTIEVDSTVSLEIAYHELNAQLAALLGGERDLICNAAQFSAFVMQTIPDLNWSGFYFARDEELVLGPYVGKVACTRIPFGRGVCGKAAQTLQVQRIDDVHAFDGHIACDAVSASELVVPVVVDGKLVAVFDMDSPKVGRFSEIDQAGIVSFVATFIKATDVTWSL
jgi:GAF domain-containing protein